MLQSLQEYLSKAPTNLSTNSAIKRNNFQEFFQEKKNPKQKKKNPLETREKLRCLHAKQKPLSCLYLSVKKASNWVLAFTSPKVMKNCMPHSKRC